MKKFEVTINKEFCKGCELCVHFCPKQALEMSETVNSKGYHFAEFTRPAKCTGCRQCALICPDAAIEIKVYDKEKATK